jgi:hypothetical protein
MDLALPTQRFSNYTVLQMWTLLLNGRVWIWSFQRNNVPNTWYKFNRYEFLAAKLLESGAMENATMREVVFYSRQKHCIQGAGDKTHRERKRDR